MNTKLKPSIKSVEGSSFIGVMASCIGLLYTIFFVDKGGNVPSLDELLKVATSVADISEAYKSQVNWIGETVGLGSTSALLVFMYKTFSKFSTDRSELKMAEILEGKKE